MASRNQQDFRREDESEEDADSEAPSPSLVVGHKPTISEAQRVYLDSNNSKKQLYLLSLGINDDDDIPIYNIDLVPWKDISRREIKPKKEELAREVLRCAQILPLDKNEIQHFRNPCPMVYVSK